MKRARTGAVAALLIAMVLGGAPAATAQTGYPPPLCSVTFSTQALGTITVGSTVTFQLSPVCDWTPGSPVNVTVNGVFVGNKIPSAAGTVSVLVEALSPTLLSIDDPVLVPARCGTNTIRAVGPSTAAGGVAVTHEASFQLDCPAPVAQPKPPRRQVAFTGDHVATLTAGAVLLVAWGALLVVGGRRRRSSSAAA